VTEIVQRGRLYVGSYVGLFALLAIRFDTRWLQLTCIGLAVLGTIFMLWIVFVVAHKSAPSRSGSPACKTRAPRSPLPRNLPAPFPHGSHPSVRDVIAYGIFLFIGGLIYVRSEMTQVNPTCICLVVGGEGNHGRRMARLRRGSVISRG